MNNQNILSARSISENAIPEEQDEALHSNSSSNNYNSLTKFENYPLTYISFDEGDF